MTEMSAGDQIPKVSKARQSGRGNGAGKKGTESRAGVGGDQESARVEEGKPARRLSQELRVSDLSQVTFLSDFRIYAVLGFSIFEPSVVKVITVILSYTSFQQRLLVYKYFRELRKPTPKKGKKKH